MVVRPKTPAFAGDTGTLLALEQHKFQDGTALGVRIKFPRPMPWRHPGKNTDNTTGWTRAFRVIVIDNPPGQDETLSWCPVPQPVKETA